jgi:hypothetical protein
VGIAASFGDQVEACPHASAAQRQRQEVSTVNGNQVLRKIGLVLTASFSVALVSIAVASDAGQAAADQITEASYRYYLGDTLTEYGILYTHTGHNRGVGGAQHDLARDNIAAHFEAYGLTVTLEPVYYGGTYYYNVVGTKPGVLYPEQEFVVGAHYDSVSNPGADDDASGVALVLDCARVITQYDSDYTIRFVAFTREEQGLYGSYAYVADHAGDDILGMVQTDMVAYDPDTNHALVYGHDSPALPLKNALRQAISDYSEYQGISLTSTDSGWNGQSDHAPFDAAGYQACMLIEGQVWSNPYYHTQQDSVDNPNNINYPYAVRMAKSVCGFLVDAAGVDVPVNTLAFDYPNGRPAFIAPTGGTTMQVNVIGVGDGVPQPGTGIFYYDLGSGWQSVPMDVLGENMYEAVFPAADCGAVVSYYVSAQSTDSEIFTDPRSAPLAAYTTTAAYGEEVLFEDDFETDLGWTVSGNAATGHWERGVPAGGGERGDPPTDYDGSGQCYLTGNAYGDSDVDDGYTYLTSPVIDLSDGDADITYALWYTNNYGADPNNDLFKTYVSDNGGSTWTLAETVGPATSGGWNLHAFTVGEFVTPNSQVRVRFEASDLNSGSVVEAGVDAVFVTRLICQNPCFGDLDGDDDVDLTDLAQLLSNYGLTGGATYEDGDLDADDDVDLSDLAALLSVYGTVCD